MQYTNNPQPIPLKGLLIAPINSNDLYNIIIYNIPFLYYTLASNNLVPIILTKSLQLNKYLYTITLKEGILSKSL